MMRSLKADGFVPRRKAEAMERGEEHAQQMKQNKRIKARKRRSKSTLVPLFQRGRPPRAV